MALQIYLGGTADSAEALAAFFCSNLSPEYISHSELQGSRAVAPRQWAPDIRSQVEAELHAALRPAGRRPRNGDVMEGVVIAREDGVPVGLAIPLTRAMPRHPTASSKIWSSPGKTVGQNQR